MTRIHDSLLQRRETELNSDTVLFGTPQAAGGATLEVHTFIGLVIYALVAWLLARAAWLAFGEGRSASVARSDTVQTRAR